jgi:hypothetical protein
MIRVDTKALALEIEEDEELTFRVSGGMSSWGNECLVR